MLLTERLRHASRLAVPMSRLNEVMDGVGRALDAGKLVYWICPLVEESEAEGTEHLTNATKRFESLQKRFGARAYLSPGYDSGHWVGDEHGRLERINDEQRGINGFKVATDWIEQHDGSLNGRIRGILVPRRVWTTTLDLLKRTVAVADEKSFRRAAVVMDELRVLARQRSAAAHLRETFLVDSFQTAAQGLPGTAASFRDRCE